MSIAFDASYYLLQYPDVAAAVVRGQFPNAYTHFVLHGARELRNPNAQFNAAEYAGMNPDVANAVAAGTITNVWDHYVTFGIAENRAPSLALKDFDAASYLSIHTDVAAAVTAGAFKSAIDHYLLNGQAEGRTWGEDVALTNGTDKLVANKFVAGLVYTPGGNDRINALQDEDQLTGIGVNPTLTATLGNSNDNGGPVITPILKGIETVNVAFTGSGTSAVTTLDLQDSTGLTKAVNITRITDTLTSVKLQNLTSVPAELSLTNTHSPATSVDFTFLTSAVTGTADATKLTLSNAQVGALTVQSKDTTKGVETITLASTSAPNVAASLTAQDLQTLIITGDQALTLTGTSPVYTNDTASLVEASTFTGGLLNVAGSLSKIDGSAATGNLTLNIKDVLTAVKDGTSGTDIAVEVLGGKGNDVFISNGVGANDKIDGGDGANTLILTGGTVSGTVAKVQTLDIRVDEADSTVDTSKLTQLETVVVRNESHHNPVTVPDVNRDIAVASPQTVTLTKLSADVASKAGIVVKHGTTGNNDIASLTVDVTLANASGANDLAVFTIAEGVNANPRFNVTLDVGDTTDATRVESITINDSDSEANTVKLTQYLQHTGTITLKGGTAGVFLNLDSEENIYNKDKTGLTAAEERYVVNTVGTNIGALVASVIDAESFVGDAIVRVSSSPLALSAVGAQTVKLGSGNDTLVFDNLADSRAGLTISDTVSGGAGNDTLAIGGDQAVKLGQSEWTNVTGFETIRLLGNGASYILELTDGLITRNAADGKIINIINDNNPLNDAAGSALVGGDAVSDAIIDARALSAGLSFNYNGEEGAITTDRFIFVDHNINASAIIDGGARDNLATTNSARNNDVLEVRNSAVVSTGDLLNIKNVGKIELTNDSAAVQNFTIQLNDTVVDALVDSYHTSTAAESETLFVEAIDSPTVLLAHSVLRLEASDLTARSNLSVTGGAGADVILLGGGADTVNSGAGNDSIVAGAGDDSINSGDGNDTIDAGAGNDSVNAGNGNDSIIGGAGNDTINGGDGDDIINGGDGDDIITGGAGADALTGGSGADAFVYALVADSAASVAASTTVTFDSISDFTTTTDKVTLTTINAVLTGAGPATGITVTTLTTGAGSLNDTTIADFAELKTAVDAVGLVASAAGVAGGATGLQAYIIDLTGNTGALGTGKYLVVNNNDAVLTAADLMIQLTGTSTSLVANDFIL